MKGDFLRYNAEVTTGSEYEKYHKDSAIAYEEGLKQSASVNLLSTLSLN